VLGCHYRRIHPCHPDFFARSYRHVCGSADETRFALENGYPRRLIDGRRGLDVVGTGLQDPKRATRDLDFDALSSAEIAQLQMDPPLPKARLDLPVVQVEHIE
jgi:hypothetical protein